MNSIGIWLSPLLLLPGAALLILSTSIRFNRLHDEIHHIAEHESEQSELTINKLLLRARYFRNSLVFLYLSVALFAIAGLLGGITSGLGDISFYLTVAITISGIFCLAAASVILIKESSLSLEIMESHFSKKKKK